MGAAVSTVHADAVDVEVPAPAPKVKGLSAQEVQEAKNELLEEMVAEIVGEEGANLEELVTPEVVTAPYDPRFPNTNQSRHCFIRYNEFYKCAFERSEDDERCQFYKRTYESICPADWLELWEESRANGTWYGKY